VPYEQNTQQSPGRGFISAPQDGHSSLTTQASSGIILVAEAWHSGQVIVDSKTIPAPCFRQSIQKLYGALKFQLRRCLASGSASV
jgi:hypothetical protein